MVKIFKRNLLEFRRAKSNKYLPSEYSSKSSESSASHESWPFSSESWRLWRKTKTKTNFPLKSYTKWQNLWRHFLSHLPDFNECLLDHLSAAFLVSSAVMSASSSKRSSWSSSSSSSESVASRTSSLENSAADAPKFRSVHSSSSISLGPSSTSLAFSAKFSNSILSGVPPRSVASAAGGVCKSLLTITPGGDVCWEKNLNFL